MKRLWVGIAAACVVIAIVVFLVVQFLGDSNSPQPAARRPTTSAPASGSTSPGLPLSTRMGLGLRAFIKAHPVSAERPATALTSCPFGPVRTAARTIDAAAEGTSAAYTDARAVVQRYRVRVPNNGSVGDRGDAVSCTGTSTTRTILGLSAATNTNLVPKGAITGLDGPRAYSDGNTYAKVTGANICSVYWVPPNRDYNLTVVFQASSRPSLAQCRSGFAVVAPTIFDALAAFAA